VGIGAAVEPGSYAGEGAGPAGGVGGEDQRRSGGAAEGFGGGCIGRVAGLGEGFAWDGQDAGGSAGG
jgi:hypothetical protein